MIEQRLRDALGAAADIDPATVRPLRAAPRRHRMRYVAIPAALVAAVAIFAAARLLPAQEQPMTFVGMSAPEPGEIRVFLCRKPDTLPACRHTAGDRARIAAKLDTFPQVAGYRFIDQAEAYRMFLRYAKGELRDVVRVSDMPESFRVRLKLGADGTPVVRALREVPGVLLAALG
ncbi:permease-like cell division protein FtsX [Streptosporangiaceae bacterium NEAU-GS5]|nr:permease-like cell division protein FtsX [Streptosporangiaceae bacterium NEAU-GS5]